mgnify:CR=1 FL=1
MKKILVLEDEASIRSFIVINLRRAGYDVIEAETGEEALERLRANPDTKVALLDIMLPGIDGFEVCRRIRATNTKIGIIMLTARSQEMDKVTGLMTGADDYVTKPFSVTVLCKKVAAVFANLELRTPRHDLFDDGFLKIDFSEQSASLAGESLDFTPKEYRTLFLFVKNPRIILTKRQILEKLWDIDGDFVDEHTLTTIISRIRKKIETDERKYIKTAYGMGYQWIGGEPR